MNSVTKVCSIFVLLFNYFSTEILTFILFECSSVQMKPALMSFTLFNPFIFFNKIESSYLLSLSQATQGGLIYLWQKRQKLIIAYLVMPIVMSVLASMHASQTLDSLGWNWIPHIGHKILASCSSIIKLGS